MFKPRSGRQEYCTKSCKDVAYYKEQKSRKLECKYCSVEFVATSPTSIFCSPVCRKTHYAKDNKIEKVCLYCQKDISSVYRSRKFCSVDCGSRFNMEKRNTGVIGKDYIVCPICGKRSKQISFLHAKLHGFSSPTEMAKKLNIITTCSNKREKQSGKNNPGFNHGGKYSKFSKNFIHGYDKDWHDKHIENTRKSRKDNPEKYINTIEYWIEYTNGDTEEAKKLHKKSQTRDINYFISKYGEIEGTKRHLNKVGKWLKSFKKNNYSIISQELFNEIVASCDLDLSYVYYATFDRVDKKDYQNKEYRLLLKESYILPDFIYLKNNRIIEFDGNYWHGSSVTNPSREMDRDRRIIEAGYSVLHVSENDYKENKEKVIQECINFLTK